MGFFKKDKKKSYSYNHNIAGMRTCFDCVHHGEFDEKTEKIFCKWDSEYYYVETGESCDDFNKGVNN